MLVSSLEKLFAAMKGSFHKSGSEGNGEKTNDNLPQRSANTPELSPNSLSIGH
jgi:hypothetical protein